MNFSLREWMRNETEGGGRTLLGDNTGGGTDMQQPLMFQLVVVGFQLESPVPRIHA